MPSPPHRFSVSYRDRDGKEKALSLPLSSLKKKYLSALSGHMETLH